MSRFLSYITTAWKQLVKNIGRSILTMLGIIIGIGSVIFIMSSGEVAKQFLLGQITQFGTNVLEVAAPGAFGPFGESDEVQLTEADVDALESSDLLPEIEAISAGYTTIETLEHGTESATVSIFSDRPEVFEVNNMVIISGRPFNDADMKRAGRVIVVPESLAEDLYGHTDVIGERVKLGGVFFTIIGLTEALPVGGGFGGSPEMVYAPITTVKELFADPTERDVLTFMLIEFEQDTDVESFKNRVSFVLREEHDLLDAEEDPFFIMSREQALDIFDNVLLGIQAFISAVAGISLFVGGIGIMNIMLVTVNERTKEIGLRKAIGAPNSSILWQFLIESVVLTTVGGVVGITVGLGLTTAGVAIANVLKPDWGITYVFVPQALIIACAVAVTVGIVFGLYPALKASRLHPIEALRYE